MVQPMEATGQARGIYHLYPRVMVLAKDVFDASDYTLLHDDLRTYAPGQLLTLLECAAHFQIVAEQAGETGTKTLCLIARFAARDELLRRIYDRY